MKIRFASVLALAMLLCLCLSGCFIQSADELYALPKLSDEYADLQNVLSEILTGQAQYSSPVSGSNQQPVQMSDLDGDGQDEAIVFVNTGGARPLKAYILDRREGNYEPICAIEGDGSTFDRVEYAQLDGVGGMEIVVGRQLSNQVLQSIGAYSIVDGQLVELMSANYSEFTIVDLDQNGNEDLFLLRFDAEARTGIAELYRCADGVLEREPEASMSVGVGSVRHITTGSIAEGLSAVFVGSITDESSVLTDIFTFRSDNFTAVSSWNDLRLQSVPVRGYNVYATDIDNDGFVEIPNVVQLPDGDPENTEDDYFVIKWYNYDPSRGLTLKENTYHNYSSGWFLRLPEKLGTNFIVQRREDSDGSRGLFFCRNNGRDEPGGVIFSLYAFTGSGRNISANQEARFPVGSKGETTFAAKLGDAAQRIGLTQEELTSMFNFIRIDWYTGEM